MSEQTSKRDSEYGVCGTRELYILNKTQIFPKWRKENFRDAMKQVEGKVSWRNEMERVSCSLSPSQSRGLILVSVDRETGGHCQDFRAQRDTG